MDAPYDLFVTLSFAEDAADLVVSLEFVSRVEDRDFSCMDFQFVTDSTAFFAMDIWNLPVGVHIIDTDEPDSGALDWVTRLELVFRWAPDTNTQQMELLVPLDGLHDEAGTVEPLPPVILESWQVMAAFIMLKRNWRREMDSNPT